MDAALHPRNHGFEWTLRQGAVPPYHPGGPQDHLIPKDGSAAARTS